MFFKFYIKIFSILKILDKFIIKIIYVKLIF